MRGEAISAQHDAGQGGITPACAGRSYICIAHDHSTSDHPRVCGEKVNGRAACGGAAGSPPRVRGEGDKATANALKLGITPACAGRRWRKPRRRSASWDHPRVCGEKLPRRLRCWRRWGSPPRVRGEGEGIMDAMKQGRITPACAGRRHLDLFAAFRAKDHPRVCGEKAHNKRMGTRRLGSPPRVRGEGSVNSSLKHSFRITPACAGRRYDFTRVVPVDLDHPRVCGEKGIAQYRVTLAVGSPPRVRGEVFLYRDVLVIRRITPACAGRRHAGKRKDVEQ